MVKHTKVRRTRGRRMRGGEEGMDDGSAVTTTPSTEITPTPAAEEPGVLSKFWTGLKNKFAGQTAGRHTRRHRTGRKGRKGSKSRRA